MHGLARRQSLVCRVQTLIRSFLISEWLNPDLYDRDTTGVNRYLRMCERLEIQPITYFLKHMQDKELVMKYHGLGPLGVKAMSDPLEVCINSLLCPILFICLID